MKTFVITPVIMLLVLSVILAGCGNNQQSIVDTNYYEGSDGVVFNIIENSPPEVVYGDSSQVFPVSIKVQNKGAYSIYDPLFAKATVSFDSLYFSQESSTMQALAFDRSNIQLAGKSAYWPTGESRLMTLQLLQAKDLGPRTGAETLMLISMCYPYETLLTTQVCIDGDLYAQDGRDQVCHAEDMTFTDQGAPVAITNLEFKSMPAGTQEVSVVSNVPVTDDDGNIISIEPRATSEQITLVKPLFRFTIENVGGGVVVGSRNPNDPSLCDQTGDGSFIINAQLGNSQLVCNPLIPRFIDGIAEISCTTPGKETMSVVSNYEQTLQVRLSYTYRVRESKSIEIIDELKEYVNPVTSMTETCSDFHNNADACKLAASTKGCSWCPQDGNRGQCLSDQTCSACGIKTAFDQQRKECTTPCANIPPKVTISHTLGQSFAKIICTDVANAAHGICGCDEQQIYFAYTTDPNEFDCGQSSFVQKTGTYTAAHTEFDVSIDPSWQYLCAYAKDYQGRESPHVAKKLTK